MRKNRHRKQKNPFQSSISKPVPASEGAINKVSFPEESAAIEVPPPIQDDPRAPAKPEQQSSIFPEEFLCPETGTLLAHPMISVPYGITYERSFLLKAKNTDGLDPIMGEKFTRMVPNKIMAGLIQVFSEKYQALPPQAGKKYDLADFFNYKDLLCPITGKLLTDPVLHLANFKTYQSSAFKNKTGNQYNDLVPNWLFKLLIDRLISEGVIETLQKKFDAARQVEAINRVVSKADSVKAVTAPRVQFREPVLEQKDEAPPPVKEKHVTKKALGPASAWDPHFWSPQAPQPLPQIRSSASDPSTKQAGPPPLPLNNSSSSQTRELNPMAQAFIPK